MQSIQLYIEGQRVDMFKDESVSITQSIQNVKDIAKVFTEFTKTFTLPHLKRITRYSNTTTTLISQGALMRELKKMLHLN